MSTCVRSLQIYVSLISLFVLFQTQIAPAQELHAPRSIATAAAGADLQAVASSSQVAPALPVPRLIKFSGVSKDVSGQPRSGVVGITFSIYASQEGGAPLWMETQNIELDAHGRYAVLLGASKSAGMPLNLFATGEPRWLGTKVQLPGEVEQPRVLLVSVPYALKASDADTVGGMPPSAFVMAPTGSSSGASVSGSAKSKASKSGAKPQFSNSGTANYIPMFTDNSGDIADSIIYQSASGNIGIGFNNPNNARLVVVGNGGAIMNASNDVDTDFYIDLTTPGATIPYTQFGPGTSSNLALGVGGQAKVWIQNNGAVGINTTTPGAMLDVEGVAANATVGVIAAGIYGGIEGFSGSVNGNGGYFYGYYDGSYSVSYTDTAFYTGAYGYEYGATQETFGVFGYTASPIGIGNYGQAVSASAIGPTIAGSFPIGVWGDSGNAAGVGLYGSTDDGYALLAYNNSSSGHPTAIFDAFESTSATDVVMETIGNNYGGICTMDVSGNLACTGSKSAVVPVDGGSRKVALYAIEGPENWFEDAGGGQLHGGEAVVNLESVFGQTVNTGVDYRVFLTPNGDCKGLYVAQKSATSFVVRELGGGTSNIAFDYRIMAKRKGYEEIRLADKTELFSAKKIPVRSAGAAAKPMPTAEEIRKRVEKHVHKPGSVAKVSMPTINHKR